MTGAAKSISIFNSSISDIKENLSSGQGFFYSIFQSNKLNNNDVQGILNYAKAVKNGANETEAFQTHLTGCSIAARKYINDARDANKTTEQITAGLKDAAKAGGGFKGVIANIGSTFLNSLIGAGIGVAINLIIAGITNLVKAADEAKKKAVENANAYNNQKKELESLRQKYIEIMDSEKDEATKAKELDTIKNTLAETYGVEKEALDKLNESRQAGLDLMDEEAVKNAKTVINENQAQYNKYSKEAMDTETGKSNYYQRKTGEDGTYAEQNNQEQSIRKFLEQYGINAKVEKDNQNTLHNFAFEYGESAYSAYENINDALSKLSEKEQKEGLNPIEQVVIDQLRIDSDKLKKYLYDSDNGIDNIMSSTADAFWTEYSSEFEKASNKSFDDIDTLDGLERRKQGFIDSLGDFANDPYFSQYIEKLFDEKKKEIQKAATETEQAITYPTVNVTELNTKLEETSEKLDKITTSASKVQSALKSAFSKESFNVDEVLSLVELMPELADKFKMNDDGTFSINYKDLQSGAESYIKTQKQEIDTTNELIDVKIKELEANIALNKSRLLTSVNGKYDDEYNQNIKSAISTDEGNLATLKSQLSEGKVKSEYLAKSAEDLSASFSAVIDVLTNRYEVITDVEDAISDNGSITLDTLNKVKEVYPELSDEVSNYMMGLIDEQSLLSKLKDAYDDDFYEYRNTIVQKIDLTDEELQTYLNALNTKYAEDTNYYEHIGALSKNFIDYMKDNYEVDLQNCKTWNDAKLKMQQETIAKVKALAAGVNIEDYYNFETGKKIGDWSELYSLRGLTTSGVLGEINNILSSYGEGIQEFGKLFKSTSTLDAVSSKSSSSKKNSTKSTTSEIFDWIEVRLNRLADKTKSFFDKASDYISNVTNERKLGKAITATQNEINANKRAEQKYRQKANSIKLSESWKKKVREGNFSINELTDETLIKNIQDYQKWWEKARDSAQNIADLTEQKKDYLSQQFDSKLERQQRVTTKYSNASQKQNDIISLKQTKGRKITASDYKTSNKYLAKQNESLEKENKLLEEQQKKVAKGSKEWQKLEEQKQSNKSTIRQNRQEDAENNKTIAEMALNKAITNVDNKKHDVTTKQGVIDYKNANGEKVTAKDYDNLSKAISSENSALNKQKDELIKLRDVTEKGSDAWNDYNSQIQSVDESIQANTTQLAETHNDEFDARIAGMDSQIDGFKATADSKKNDISLKQTQGKRIRAKDYDILNNSLYAQNSTLGAEDALLEKELKTVEKGSQRWQELTDKISSNTSAREANNQEIAENDNSKFDLKIADYDDKIEEYQNKITDNQGKLDLRTADGKKNDNSYYKQMISASKNENKVLEEKKKAIETELKTTQEGSERYRTLSSDLQSVNENINQNKISQAEWNATIRDLPMDRIKEYLDLIEAFISAKKSYVETMLYIYGEGSVSASKIREQKYSKDAISNQKTLYEDYYNEWQKAKKEGRTADVDKYEKMYYEGLQTYNEMLKANEELERQARDIELYRNYEKDLQHIEDVKKALSSLSSMLNDDALYNDDGSFSEHGIAKIALTMKNLEEAKSSVGDYKKEIDALNKAHKQGKYNDDEYAEKLRELTDGYQNATSEVNNYTEAIKDLYKNQAQEELNALNELIDLRAQALQKKKDYYSYDKTIKSKTKDITAMQMQIEALNGVSTAESKAQKALLEEQLSDLEEDLADTQADHIYQVQIDGLNEQKEILQDIYDKFVDSLNKCLDAEETIISNATTLSQNSIETVRKLLDDIAKARGYDLNYVDNNNSLAHFADGGKVISAKSKGRDDGVAWLKAGEFVLNEQAFKAFKYTLPTIDNLADKMSTIVKSASNYDKAVSIGDVQLIVQGNVDRNVMDDLKKYQKQITDSVITNIAKDLRKVGYKR